MLVHLLLLPRPCRGTRPRPLWLFDRSWGAQATRAGFKFVWKDSEDLRHADRQLEAAAAGGEGRWLHLALRLWESEALVELDGGYLIR